MNYEDQFSCKQDQLKYNSWYSFYLDLFEMDLKFREETNQKLGTSMKYMNYEDSKHKTS
jgi:hypothetical protein